MTNLVINPFQSTAQRAWMYANEPAMARRWESHTPKGRRLPRRRRRTPTTNGRVARLDPSRTVTLRRQWCADVARRFAALRRDLLRLIVEEDALGLRRRPSVFNAFCPTGEGGGVDPTCSPKGVGGKPADVSKLPKNLQKFIKSLPRKFTDGATFRVRSTDMRRLAGEQIESSNYGGGGMVTIGRAAVSSRRAKEAICHELGHHFERQLSSDSRQEALEYAREHVDTDITREYERYVQEGGYSPRDERRLDREYIAELVREHLQEGKHRGLFARLRGRAPNPTGSAEKAKKGDTVYLYGNGEMPATVAKVVRDKKGDFFKLTDGRMIPVKWATMNAFCPTGKGGGIDPTCPAGHSFSSSDRSLLSRWAAGGSKQEKLLRSKKMDTLLKKAPLVQGKVYRGVYGITIRDFRPGDTVRLSRHVPASSSKTVGRQFAEFKAYSDTHEGHLLEIESPSSKDISSGVPEEYRSQHEAIVPRGTTLQYLGKRKLGRKLTLYRFRETDKNPNTLLTMGRAKSSSLDGPALLNVFCPTGEGGGVDPTCSPKGASSLGDDRESASNPPRVIYHSYMSSSGHYTMGQAIKSRGLFALPPSQFHVRGKSYDPFEPNEYGDAVVALHLNPVPPLKIFEAEDQYDALEKLFGKKDAETWFNKFEQPDYGPEVYQEADERIGEKLRMRGYWMLHYTGTEQYGHEWAVLDSRAIKKVTSNNALLLNAFCPTGEGGGIDPTCSPPGASSLPEGVKVHPESTLAREVLKGKGNWTVRPVRVGRENIRLSIEPKGNTEGFVTEPVSEWRYDPSLAETVSQDDDVLTKLLGPRLVLRSNSGLSEDIQAVPKEGVIFRGMSADELKAFQSSGSIASEGEYNLGKAEEGLTFGSVDPAQAAAYATSFAPWHYLPAPGRSGYVVEMRQPSEPKIVRGDERGYAGKLKWEDVIAVHEAKVAGYRPGYTELVDPVRDVWGEGSRRSPSIRYGWKVWNPKDQITTHSFCPTGEGGGIDPTCSPHEGYHGTTVEVAERIHKEGLKGSSAGAVGHYITNDLALAHEYGRARAIVRGRLGTTKVAHQYAIVYLKKSALKKFRPSDPYSDDEETARQFYTEKDIPRSQIAKIEVFDVDNRERPVRIFNQHVLKDCVYLVLVGNQLRKLEANVFCPTGEGGGIDPTCPGHEGSAQTSSPAFKKWFGDSKVVDEQGKPLVMYHGTGGMESFDEFKAGYKGAGGPDSKHGFFFASSPEGASEFTYKEGSITGHVFPVHLAIQNPGVIDAHGAEYHNLERWSASIQQAKDNGHDGFVIKNFRIYGRYPSDIWIAFKPEQIKSATGNRGTFDPDDPIITHAEGRWQFHSTEQKLTAFREWIKRQVALRVVGEQPTEQQWWDRYVADGFRRGAARAFDDVRPEVREGLGWDRPMGWYQGTREEFLRSSFYHPVSREKVQLLASRTFTDLKGVTDAMAARMGHALVDGLTRGENPRVIGRELAKAVDVGRVRAQTIARTEVIRCHAEGQLDAFKRMGVTHVGVMAEWMTAQDERVCKLCLPLEGMVLKVDEAEGLLPRHPNCRCAWIPANVGEDEGRQRRTKGAIERAVDASYQAEGRKGLSLEEKRQRSSWGAADKAISPSRPKGVFNVFCPTGEGGGVDPSCKERGGTATKPKVMSHRAAVKLALRKMRAAPVPTAAEAREANRRIDQVGADRYEADIRGNTTDRARSRRRLLEEFGDGRTCRCVYCGLRLTEKTITRDKIYTAREGGRYQHSNLVPSCLPCNQRRGDTPWRKIKLVR